MNYFNYFSEIEETFIRRRGKSLLLSPLDWTLIESWQKRGIPQHIVIRSIEKIFDDIARDPKRNPNIKSISYCSDEVERQFREWQASRAGAHTEEHSAGDTDTDTEAGSEIIAHLSALIATIDEAVNTAQKRSGGALAPVLSETLDKLKALKEKTASISAEKIESELSEMESTLDNALLKDAGEAEISAAREAVDRHLRQYAGKMQQEAYEKTFELMVIKKLREKYGIAAFSLFNL